MSLKFYSLWSKKKKSLVWLVETCRDPVLVMTAVISGGDLVVGSEVVLVLLVLVAFVTIVVLVVDIELEVLVVVLAVM